ncbi:MAG: DUF1330 domain-containing protein [Xanthobacteraceae bacterium]
MPAYWVARSKINDPAEYKKYTDRVPAIIAKFGGKVLARGGRFQVMEGPHKFQRFVVIEFPTFEQGVACFTSKEYDEAAAFRRRNGAGEVETIMVDGGDATKLPPTSLRGATRRSNPLSATQLDCFALLAMTFENFTPS